jgi:hypothetical protein
MSDLLQDRIDLFRPDERFGILVVDPDEIFDCRDEFRDAAENPATNAFARNLSEPSLHQVQPGRAGRRDWKGAMSQVRHAVTMYFMVAFPLFILVALIETFLIFSLGVGAPR